MGQPQTAEAISDSAGPVTPSAGGAAIGTGVPGATAPDDVVVLAAVRAGASPGRPSALPFGDAGRVPAQSLSDEDRQRRREAVIHDLEQARRRRRRPQGVLVSL